MGCLFEDTDPRVEQQLVEMLRQLPTWRKMQMVAELNAAVKSLLWSGLRARYPNASEAELRRRVAGLLLGEELAQKVYGDMPMMPEPIAVTLKVTFVLENLKVDYAISGSIATALYGVARATQDVDIVADFKVEHVAPLAEMLQTEFYVDAAMISDAVARRETFNLIHYETVLKVDVFVARDHPLDRAVISRARRYSLHPETSSLVSVVAPEEAVLAKLWWYRQGREVAAQQWKDVLGVLRLQADTLDTDYMHRFAEQLGVHDLLQRALQEIG
jgi:hypothetical protein